MDNINKQTNEENLNKTVEADNSDNNTECNPELHKSEVADANITLESPEPVTIEKSNNFIKKYIKLIIPAAIIVIAIIVLICIISKPNVISISASYTGDTVEGIALSNKNKGIEVKGIDEKGKEVNVSGWEVEEPVLLEADNSQTIVILYKDLKTKLTVECSSSKALKITASYSDSLKEGTVITNDNISVMATLKNGEEVDVTADSKMNPEKLILEKDGVYDIEFEYTDPISGNVLSSELNIECSTMSIESISAKYSGKTDAGTLLDKNNSGITVTALLKNGNKKELTEWEIEKPVELKADTKSSVKITFEEFSCDLEVVCSTMSESKYKEMCKAISYDNLLRNPGKYEGKYIKLTGTVFQIVSESSGFMYYSVYFIRSGGNLYRVNIDNYNSETRILEDDTITVWGTVDEIYTYETIRGNSNTIPQITAEYFK